MLGITISAVLAFVAGILSYGLFVPDDLRVFSLLEPRVRWLAMLSAI